MSDDGKQLARVETPGQLSVAQVTGRLGQIIELMRSAMADGQDYGKVPGTNKPTLLKPGAEKLCVMFCLDPEYETELTYHDDGHLTVKTYCTIHNSQTQVRLGGATAVCSTRESKYAFRRADRCCPRCGKAAVIKGSEQYGGGWLCWKKKAGCGAKFPDGDATIETQAVGRVANPDLADSYNTVVRIAEKRAFVAATRQVTGASAIFDEEIPDRPPEVVPPEPAPPPRRQEKQDVRRDDAPRSAGRITPQQMQAVADLGNEVGATVDHVNRAVKQMFAEAKKLGDLTEAQGDLFLDRMRRSVADQLMGRAGLAFEDVRLALELGEPDLAALAGERLQRVVSHLRQKAFEAKAASTVPAGDAAE